MNTDRREIILNAFIEIGRRKGLDNTTMKDISREVGISVGTIYLYFKNKEDLVETFLRSFFQNTEDYFAQILQQPSNPEQMLYSLTVNSVVLESRFCRENKSLADFFHNDVIKYTNKNNLIAHRQSFESKRIEAIKIALARGGKEGLFFFDDINITARMIFFAFASFHGPVAISRAHEEIVADAEHMFTFLLKGLQKEYISKS
ncbi:MULTISPECIES: TetR/AcrR family transcriptional regulator [Pelosinus]|jgi:AcrR family transcriptional regulator|uniref:Regulatory protein TetR n=1 Tax=Pelosinus fermentans B4 TaxID=1149862 RepID=I9B3N4_9FIRM|nr:MULTISPECIES: TetR/AcrR family transcriptional regulator [Pelosinus]EIW19757.1 regulatory protein TetR [Pelosinus fermentans B4]EIW21386.1 transcriptional regulator, TetR family [Pelosinus fermentans A11]OAM94910.1 transcriptional regulator, TetR family [Pelosinus fermentans DSM 17108]SDR20176.1 DNA-binding transcriptional regulator, AcrR family [Pelosinus fermentans]